ncbi:sulfite exporter TauE/SafE family protein [Oceanobacillus bengalensis]|uniref:Probable membrane transporter protein n=1 Tax=Oceanobacillus bengalensis TaxID=1435466 RepID=A0A494YRJ5_9BACI|nr:sulfite exporter TauE/SafE family protein [Oceanobacillus bengalensis]RKQ11974.1 hypothetical protein D8M05_19085 [Oceanobacillus bengalensis]
MFNNWYTRSFYWFDCGVRWGNIAWEYVLPFIPGAWIGTKIGAKVNQMLNGRTLEWVLRILLIFNGLRMIF